jgi:hypothetical protein
MKHEAKKLLKSAKLNGASKEEAEKVIKDSNKLWEDKMGEALIGFKSKISKIEFTFKQHMKH